MPYPSYWSDVDPNQHPFDLESIDATLMTWLPETEPADLQLLPDFNTLAEFFGVWTKHWMCQEISGFCCENHAQGTRTEVINRVKIGLISWRSSLENLAKIFAEFKPLPSEDAVSKFELVAVTLINEAVSISGAHENWGAFCKDVLGWYLESCDVSDTVAECLAESTIEGRFESWTFPSEQTVKAVAHSFAIEVDKVIYEKQHSGSVVEDSPVD